MNRLIIPDTRLIEGVIKVFVKTGPAYNENCEVDAAVEVDLVMPGMSRLPMAIS